MSRASMMMSYHDALNLDECVAQIWQSKQITQEQCSFLKTWLLQMDMDTTFSHERAVIDRLLHAVRRGWVALS